MPAPPKQLLGSKVQKLLEVELQQNGIAPTHESLAQENDSQLSALAVQVKRSPMRQQTAFFCAQVVSPHRRERQSSSDSAQNSELQQ